MADTARAGVPETPTTARKRQHSTHETGAERVVKHRSSKACQSCRTRKVRCDVSAKGTRCTNCELDHLNCVVLPSRRGQSNRQRRRSPTPTTQSWPRHESVGDVRLPPIRSSSSMARGSFQAPSAAEGSNHVPAVVTFDEESDGAASDQRPLGADQTDNVVGHSDAYETLLTPETGTNTFTQMQSPAGRVPLPAFIAPLPHRILPDDLDYLALKGAFAVPEPDMCMEIIRAYLSSVHPFMPMLDFKAFTRAVLQEEDQVSLLLFHAVMFAGIHSLPPDAVHRLGYESAKQAREVFMNRARLLYDFNVEVDNGAILQSLILMSSWYSKDTPWHERRHTWHWTGLAYDLARTMGLHREPTAHFVSEKERHFRRRLWWSLYIRDRMIALGTRRPMRIRDDEFDVTMLALEDFDLEPLDSTNALSTLSPSTEESASNARMCIELAKLGVIIGRVVSSQYTTLGTQAGHTMMVMPRRDGNHTKELENCDSELYEWFDALCTNVGRNSSLPALDEPHRCSEVQWAQLNMTYLTVVNVLHRAQALQLQGDGQTPNSQSRSRIKDTARNITKLGQTMLQHDKVRFLGLIGVTALLAACLTHMLDVGSGDEDVRDASTFRLYQTLQVLESLRSVYASADSAFAFLASVTRKAGIPVPLQAVSAADFVSASPNGLSRSGKQLAHRKTSSSSPGGRYGLSSQPSSAYWSVNNFQFASGSTSGHPHPGAHAIENGRRMTTGTMAQPAASMSLNENSNVPFAAPGAVPSSSRGSFGMVSGASATTEITPQLGNPSSGGFPNLTPDAQFFEWNKSADAGMDLGPMSFNYDFFSDAFGFLDADLQGL